jgi:hypothetical protein
METSRNIPERSGAMDADRMTDSEKKAIEREIKERIGELIRGCESLDPELAFRAFSDSPAFLMMGTDGSLCDRATYVKNNVEYLRTCSALRLTTKREEIRILSPSAAVFAWAYAAEAVLKTGDRDIFDNAGASFVLQKVDGKWEAVYYHESSTPSRRVPKEA